MKQKNLTFWLAMFISMVGLKAFAYDIMVKNDDGVYIYYNYTNDKTELAVTYSYSYNAYTGNIVIPESITYYGKTYNVTSIGSSAFRDCVDLTCVKIPNSIVSIGNLAFRGCSGLTEVTIPDNVESIGSSAFYGCRGLMKLIIPNNVMSIESYAFYNCSSLTEVAIPNSVTTIGDNAFRGCSGIRELTIPNSVTSIGSSAFSGCSGIRELTIPNSVTSIGWGAFVGCSGNLERIVVENGNPYYDSRENCNAIIHTEENQLILGCKNTQIPNNIKSIGDYAFSDCSGLTELTFPSGVTSIGCRAFFNCSGLKEIMIPNSVTNICVEETFSGCSSLEKIVVENGNPYYDSRENCNAIIHTDENMLIAGCINTRIPNTITSIGYGAFQGCKDLTSIEIPNSVTNILALAFADCTGLTSVDIPNSVVMIGDVAFRNCSGLRSLTIGNSVRRINAGAFENCGQSLEKIVVENGNPYYDSRENCNAIIDTERNELILGCRNTHIPNSVTSIGWEAFANCSGLTSINIPNNVTSIGSEAFYGCTDLALITCDNETPPAAAASTFPQSVIAVVPPSALPTYQSATGWKDIQLNASFALLGTTQTTITLRTSNLLSDTYVELDGKKYTPVDGKITITGLSPNYTYWILASGQYGDIALPGIIQATTKDVKVTLSLVEATNVTLSLKGSYDAGDAIVVKKEFADIAGNELRTIATGVNETTMIGLQPGKEYSYIYYIVETADGSMFYAENSFSTKPITLYASAITSATHCDLIGETDAIDAVITDCGFSDYAGQKMVTITGLDPSQTYTTTFYVDVEGDKRYTQDIEYTTQDLLLTTSQPKVVSMGNVIVSAETNLDDKETNVGFEWRRTDWTDDFASNTGVAYIYDGTMEGYIRNLNTEKLWKYRPYYLSNSGTYYYGEWVGLDPSNTSYFEPTVHTYTTINIEGNTALVKGYALTGTDKVTVQGFKYWKGSAAAKGLENGLTAVPSDAMTVEASGQVMTASLTGLDYNATYHYVAFVTTAEGDTFYGEEQVFSTADDPTGIEDIYAETADQSPVTVVARYNIKGERIDTPQAGVNILRMNDGTTRKVWVKKP